MAGRSGFVIELPRRDARASEFGTLAVDEHQRVGGLVVDVLKQQTATASTRGLVLEARRRRVKLDRIRQHERPVECGEDHLRPVDAICEHSPERASATPHEPLQPSRQ